MSLMTQPVEKHYSSRWLPVLKVVITLFIMFLIIAFALDGRAALSYLWAPIVIAAIFLASKPRYNVQIDHGDRLVLNRGGKWNNTWTRISDIRRISIGRSMVSVRTDKNEIGKPATLLIAVSRYTPQTFGQMIKDLKEMNPSIELDDAATALVREFV